MQTIDIFEAKFRQPHIMYHGTSSVFLRSILKNGLVPNPAKKRWDADEQENQSVFNRASLDGSYWASNYMTASSSATNTRNKFGGNSIILIAQIAEQSSYADEDSIDNDIKSAMNQTVAEIRPGIRADFWLTLGPEYFGQDASERNKVRTIFMNKLHDTLKTSDKHPPNRKITDGLLDVLMLRTIAYETRNGMQVSHWVPDRDMPEIPPIQEIEKTLTFYRDQLTRTYRKTALHTEDMFNHTLRVPMTVGFSGANKILWIIQEQKYKWIKNGKGLNGGDEMTVEPMILLYGTPNLPDDFLNQYKARIGKFPGLVDKDGTVLRSAEPRN